MSVLRIIFLAMAVVASAPVAAQKNQDPIKTITLPPSRQQGLDMVLVDADAMPLEPELAGDAADDEEESWSGSPVDLLKPVHHLYTDFRRQLVRYQIAWSGLPQVRIPGDGTAIGRNSADPRLPVLRERLGLPRDGGLDQPLQAKLTDYQQAHALKGDGIAGADTLRSLNRGAAYYEKRILLNMERARRLPAEGAASKYILVDAGSARLWMYENGRVVDSMKVIVGTAESETPMIAALIRYANVNPYWNIPPDLVQKLIAPRVVSEGKSYLVDRGYEVLDSWEEDARVISPDSVDWAAIAAGREDVRVRQLPGAGNSMGDIKFMMPNDYGIYLHDTPNKALFAQDDRWLSNGCIRLEDAQRLARWIFGNMPAPQDTSRETRVDLAEPVPVYVTYLTAAPEKERIAFRADPYQRDDSVIAKFAAGDDRMKDAKDPVIAAAPAKAPIVSAIEKKSSAPAKTAPALPAKAALKEAPSAKKAGAGKAAGKASPVKAETVKAQSVKTPPSTTDAQSKPRVAGTPAKKSAPAKPTVKAAVSGNKAVARQR